MSTPPYFNVKDPGFGALGDGESDDRPHIQRAIDACVAAGGGTVFFPAGTYLIKRSGDNPYSFLLDDVDNVRFLGCGWGGATLRQFGGGPSAFSLFRIAGGCDTTEFELLTLDQSGLRGPVPLRCHLIDLVSASIVKFIGCQFTGGVPKGGAYIHAGGGAEGQTVDLVWITDGEMRSAGAPAIWLEGGATKVWILDNTIVQSGQSDAILVAPSAGETIQDLKVIGNHIESTRKFAIRLTSSGALDRIQITDNTLLGFVSATGLTKSQIQNNQIHASAPSISDPVVSVTGGSHIQIQGNIISRGHACARGLDLEVSGVSRVQVQRNTWIQEVTGAGLVHVLDTSDVQLSSNNATVANAGPTTADAYLIEARGGAIDNVQIVGDQIGANAGTWAHAVRVHANGQNVGHTQICPGILDNCAVGILFDAGGGTASRFPAPLMVAGGIVNANGQAVEVNVPGVSIHIGGNASTSGPNELAGHGSPQGAVTARIGSLYHRLEHPLDGGPTSKLYVKESGIGNTGWIAK